MQISWHSQYFVDLSQLANRHLSTPRHAVWGLLPDHTQLLGAWIATGGWALQFDRDVGGFDSVEMVDLVFLEKWSVRCAIL